MPRDLDMASPSWAYDLGWLFLDAAQCCGFECDRIYVADGIAVEAMAPGCPCQLVAVVDPRWEHVAGANCLPRKAAQITLLLDLCVLVPENNEVPDPAEVSNNARETLMARWQILQGLQQARYAENLGGGCESISPAGWIGLSHTGGIARWQTTWRFITQ